MCPLVIIKIYHYISEFETSMYKHTHIPLKKHALRIRKKHVFIKKVKIKF